MRYFVRSRYGLHIYPVTQHGMMFTANVGPERAELSHSPSDRELEWYLEYLRNNHFFRDDFFERRYLSAVEGIEGLPGRRRRRRRRGRYLKMKKLTAAQVDTLFPKTTYSEWLHAGDEADDITSVHMDADEEHEKMSTTVVAVEQEDGFEVVELRRLPSRSPSDDHVHTELDASSLAATSNVKGELHFDSGSCAICLEVYEPEDTVRGLICGHVFHADCVDPWLTRRRACCPICKRDYYTETSRNADQNNITERPPAGTEQHEPAAENHENQENHDEGTSTALEDPSQPQEVDLGETGRAPAAQDTETATNASQIGDDINIDFDILRNDPHLRSLLNELIPLSERANAILLGQDTLHLEASSRDIANKKFLNCWKRLFWRLMGIKKEDMFNWAVITSYAREQARLVQEDHTDVHDDVHVDHWPSGYEPEQAQQAQTEQTQEEQAQEEVQMEQIQATPLDAVNSRRGSNERPRSQEARRSQEEDADLAEATRQIVERRV